MTNTDRYNYAFDPEGDAWAARILRRLPPCVSVLELGPGPGAMTKVMQAKGHHVVAVENDADAIKALGAMGVEVVNANLDAFNWAQAINGRQFGSILACDVLEHLHDPGAVLRTLAGMTAYGGRLIVSIPNIGYAGVLAGLRNGNFNYADKGQLDRTHIRFFTRKSFESLLLQSGWLPQSWEAHRVDLTSSEFAGEWRLLSDVVRDSLSVDWPDFNVYQWMVEAIPANEAGWHRVKQQELQNAQAVIETVRVELGNLKAVYQQEHASLLEHQKAFGEAKTIISDLQEQLQVALDAYQVEVNRPSLIKKLAAWRHKVFSRHHE